MSDSNVQCVILAAGKSTRTYPLTVTRPKALLKIANKTILEHTLDNLIGLVKEVIVIVGFKKEMIIDYFGDEYRGINLLYVEQKEQFGTGHALLQAKDLIKDKFIMLNGDDLYSREDIEKCLEKKYCVLAMEVDYPERFGILKNEGKFVKEIVEKPESFISNLANCQAFVLDKSIFDIELKKTARGEFEVIDYVNALAVKEEVEYVVVQNYWQPVGYPWNILEANSHFLKSLTTKIASDVVIEENVHIKGEVIIGKGTLIKSGTYIEGPVIIGCNCTIGPSAYLRPDTSIGNNCTIRSEVFDAVIGDESVLKHHAYIGHSVLGNDVNIGAGTVTSDYRHDGKNHITVVNDNKIDSGRRKLGSFMGDHVRTGINTSIYPGRKIWPWTGTLPGEVVLKDKMDMALRPK
jgi:UDP-N-acetylglucosamine diphosphorylase / glucose-1-phosphate thymidylyltransferase / UDP-N-acetylgalactosamine diphosphorylase / glucosamine-1-phosphate N-acetyltransferase / galactosamine-1-phosphate N-acetyltransferase